MLESYLVVALFVLLACVLQINKWSKGHSLPELCAEFCAVMFVCILWPFAIALGLYLQLRGKHEGTTDDKT